MSYSHLLMKKFYALLIFSILILGVFAVLALAHAEDKIAKEGKLEDVDEDIEVEEVQALDNETDNIVNATFNKTKEKERKVRESARVTHFEGFAIFGDKGEPVRALWVSHTFEKNGTNMTKAAGKLELGFGDEKSKFKMLLKEITETGILFDIFPVDTHLEKVDPARNASVGTLSLTFTKYSNIIVWKGKFFLNSGKHSGTWDVTGWSRTRTIHRKDIEDARIHMIDKMQRKIDQAQEKVGEAREKAAERMEKAKEKARGEGEKVQEKIDQAREKGEEQIQRAEEKVEKIKRRWWEFWKIGR